MEQNYLKRGSTPKSSVDLAYLHRKCLLIRLYYAETVDDEKIKNKYMDWCMYSMNKRWDRRKMFTTTGQLRQAELDADQRLLASQLLVLA